MQVLDKCSILLNTQICVQLIIQHIKDVRKCRKLKYT